MSNTTRILAAVLLLLWGCTSQNTNKSLQLSSPDQKLNVDFYLTSKGAPGYLISYHNKIVIDSSALGFVLNKADVLTKGFHIVNSSITKVDTTWEQPWGEEHFIRDNHTELKIELEELNGFKRKLNIIFRAFDYGVGFRYEFPEQKNLTNFEIKDELTEFNMTANNEAWWIPAYKGNRDEFIFKKNPINELPYVLTPLTIETKDSLYVSIHEAALVDFSSMAIEAKGNNKLKCELFPWKNGVRTYVKAPMVSPWRTIQIADKPGDLITSYLILNLNEPNKIGDVSWVKPGKYVGVWWEMHLGLGSWNQGPKHAANTKNTKHYIDFAAKHKFSGVLVEGWNWGWDGNWMNGGEAFNFTKAYPDYDIEELTKYAKEKGVYIIGHHETGAAIENYENQLEEAYQFLEDNGMKGVKTGYVGDSLNNGEWHFGQYMVRHQQKVMEMAAKHHIMLTAHETIKDTGLRRTYPNFIAREDARGQEYNAWSSDGGNPPSHVTILPFTRLLSGPMDYTPGVFDLTLPTQKNQINGTLAKELALYVIIYTPNQMACDLPENYEGHPAFKFIEDVATDWETTKVLEASIGNYITTARQQRGTDNWFVGAITNEQPRQTSIKLDFLPEGKTFIATLYKDSPKTNYLTNPTAYEIESKEVNSTSVLNLVMVGSGGVAISIIEKK
ncbi:MAG TPA: glycoside hydrolase family 97 protein [Cyclobacteriaceae bacterium]|nr:glycoside hydrolase family 97 protein [Cyclobacteriaceae bacterium]